MSRRPAIAITLLAATAALAATCAVAQSARDYASEADSLMSYPDSLKAVALFRDWHAARPDDPEGYVAEANYWFARAYHPGVAVTTKPPEGGDLSLTDSTGNVAGSLSEDDRYDEELAQRAAGVLDPAIRRFPRRLDLYFGQAHIYEAIGDFDSERRALYAAVEEALAHPAEMRWTNGDTLASPAHEFVPGAVHSYATHYAEQATDLGNQHFAELTRLGVWAYPRDVRLLNDMAAVYLLANDPRSALPWLLKANAADTTDALVVANIGHVYQQLGDFPRARDYTSRVLRMTDDEQLLNEARRRLEELK